MIYWLCLIFEYDYIYGFLRAVMVTSLVYNSWRIQMKNSHNLATEQLDTQAYYVTPKKKRPSKKVKTKAKSRKDSRKFMKKAMKNGADVSFKLGIWRAFIVFLFRRWKGETWAIQYCMIHGTLSSAKANHPM